MPLFPPPGPLQPKIQNLDFWLLKDRLKTSATVFVHLGLLKLMKWVHMLPAETHSYWKEEFMVSATVLMCSFVILLLHIHCSCLQRRGGDTHITVWKFCQFFQSGQLVKFASNPLSLSEEEEGGLGHISCSLAVLASVVHPWRPISQREVEIGQISEIGWKVIVEISGEQWSHCWEEPSCPT